MEDIISLRYCDDITQIAIQKLFNKTELSTTHLWPHGTTWDVNGTNWGSDPCEDVKIPGQTKRYAFNLSSEITHGKWHGNLSGLSTIVKWKPNICVKNGDVLAVPYLPEKSNYRGEDGFKTQYINLQPQIIGKLEPLVKIISDQERLVLFESFVETSTPHWKKNEHLFTSRWTFASCYDTRRKSIIELLK